MYGLVDAAGVQLNENKDLQAIELNAQNYGVVQTNRSAGYIL